MKAEAKTIDNINILLMLLSALFAYLLPFQLFVFSYVVLGPLHYLTELTWLHQRNYFNPKPQHSYFLYGLSVLILGFLFAKPYLPDPLIHSGSDVYSTLIGFCLMASILFSLKLSKLEWLLAAALLILLYIVSSTGTYRLLFGMYLTSLIHVGVFTALFIWQGSLRSNSLSGKISIWVYAACILMLFLPSQVGINIARPYTEYITAKLGFTGLREHLSLMIMQVFGAEPGSLMLSVQRLIAFAYTYHYLNWFSKVEIIGWSKVGTQQLFRVIVAWIAVLVLFSQTQTVGVYVLFFLSLLHVIMEFPLNILSVKSIYSHYAKS